MININVLPVYLFCSTGEIRIKYYDVSKVTYDKLYDQFTSIVGYMNEIEGFIIGEVTEI